MNSEPLSLTLEETLSHLSLDEFLSIFKTSHLEHFGVLYHGSDGRNSIIGFALICIGSCWKIKKISLQKIMDEAFRVDAKGMTLVHNHPSSGALRPSVADLQTTFKIHDIAKKDGVPVLDHVIFGVDGGEFSFLENGIEI
jgi:DNA repair protein RadC